MKRTIITAVLGLGLIGGLTAACGSSQAADTGRTSVAVDSGVPFVDDDEDVCETLDVVTSEYLDKSSEAIEAGLTAIKSSTDPDNILSGDPDAYQRAQDAASAAGEHSPAMSQCEAVAAKYVPAMQAVKPALDEMLDVMDGRSSVAVAEGKVIEFRVQYLLAATK